MTTSSLATGKDATLSNACGVTLMNTVTGQILAEVMSAADNVEMSAYPSMIRVDATDRMELRFDEMAEETGEDFDQADFEEVMSTHYGRMVLQDDRVMFFANPEDAAEYIGFDLEPV